MKKIVATTLILFLLTACKKSTVRGDHFIFGSFYSECEGNCARYFMIKKGELYPDDMASFQDKLKFKNQTLSQDKYNLAKQLVDQLPDYLKNSSSPYFGCPDCHDQGGYYLEIKENSKTKKFRLDTDTSKVPNEIKNYIINLRTVLSEL